MSRRIILVMLLGIASALVKAQGLKVIPFPNLGYSPETRWYVGGVALFNFRLINDSLTRVSNVKPELNFTQNRQTIFSLNYNLFFLRDRMIILGENSYSKFPEYFWGIGFNLPETNRILYEAKRIEIDNHFLQQVIPFLNAGIRYRYQRLYALKLMDAGSTAGGLSLQKGVSSGLGYTIQYDTRDNILNARKGRLIQFSNLFFGEVTGSDFTFTRYELDMRYFSKLGPGTVAWQVYTMVHTGNPPFRMLALLGSDSQMRGYYTGRFRDLDYSTVQAEYRFKVWKAIGLAGFGGAGSVYHGLSGATDKVFPFYGAGLRIKVDKENDVNLRFDYARGEKTEGFYVVFGEAF